MSQQSQPVDVVSPSPTTQPSRPGSSAASGVVNPAPHQRCLSRINFVIRRRGLKFTLSNNLWVATDGQITINTGVTDYSMATQIAVEYWIENVPTPTAIRLNAAHEQAQATRELKVWRRQQIKNLLLTGSYCQAEIAEKMGVIPSYVKELIAYLKYDTTVYRTVKHHRPYYSLVSPKTPTSTTSQELPPKEAAWREFKASLNIQPLPEVYVHFTDREAVDIPIKTISHE
jgi:hypothetical protein